MTATEAAAGRPPGPAGRALALLAREFRHVLPPTVYFFVGFNLIMLTKRLILAEYLIEFSGFLLATTAALVVGKVVLVADKMPFLRRFDRASLIRPILFKATVYTVLVFAARLLEHVLRLLAAGDGAGGGLVHRLTEDFTWHRFAATQLWVLVLFLVYVTARELDALFGDGELRAILFTRRSSELQLTRRRRIRELVRLSHLADAHTLGEFRDPRSAAHAELIGIVERLARRDGRGPPEGGRTGPGT